MTFAISDSKANRLFWLGRYAERAYLSIHFLRRYFDLYLDGCHVDFSSYAKNLGPKDAVVDSFKDFASVYIFNTENSSSIASCLNGANDNAIMLREVITTESLSYIQMSICHLEREMNRKDAKIPALQAITDNLLAFFGSIEERLFNDKVIAFVRYGRFIESLDMHMRFDYSYSCVREVFESLLRWTEIESSVIDSGSLNRFDVMLNKSEYELNDSSYKRDLIKTVNSIVAL